MSTAPPSGWVDPSGTPQPGYPPPGYWQASDGRWYPPQQATAQTVVIDAPRPASRSAMVVLGILGALLVLGAGSAALVVASLDDPAEQLVDPATSSSASIPSSTATPIPTPTFTADAAATASTPVPADQVAPFEGDPAGAADQAEVEARDVGCYRLDDETIQVELVNATSETSTFFLTVAFLDDAGQRLGDASASVSSLRPDERAMEAVYVFESPGTRCEVIDIDRFGSASDPGELADVSACQITGTDSFGDVEATLSATNSSSEDSDYSIEIAIVDGQGIRRGTGYGYIERVRPGETAPTDLFTTAGSAPDYTCEVAYADRTASI